jgi:copper oxidase (laccase) domain-containing protein
VPASELIAWLGPAIGPTAFEVGGDVLAAFYLAETDAAVSRISRVDDKYRLDLNMIARRQLLSLGLDAQHITGGDICTFSDSSHFYSYRRDGVTGRMATVIYFD